MQAELSALLYVEGGAEPLNPSTRATRTLPMGIPFEIALVIPEAGTRPPGEGDREGDEDPDRQSIIVEITPYRPSG